MSEEKEFPLIVWEHTENFKKLYNEAEQRRGELVKEWRDKYNCDSYVSEIETNRDINGEFVFWINKGGFHTGRHYSKQRKWSAQDALENSLKYGETGWCTLSMLEDLLKGKGTLLKMAMKDCGFRPHKKILNKWVRIQPKEEYRTNKWEEEKWPSPSNEELQRLNELLVVPNEWAGHGNTYGLSVNKKGMIYVQLIVNPFAATRTEDFAWFAKQLSNRGHIAKNQNGFYIDAKNMKLGDQNGVYVRAVKPDESYIECVWPTQIPTQKIYDLANDLTSRVSESQTPDQ